MLRSRLWILLGLLLSSLLGAGMSFYTQTREPSAAQQSDQAEVLVGGLLRRCGVVETDSGNPPSRRPEECLGQELAGIIRTHSPRAVVESLLGWYQRDPMSSIHCHTMMHLVGTLVSEDLDTSEVIPFGERWGSCGSGLVHGVFEHLELDGLEPAVAGERALRACTVQEFAADKFLFRDCAHAVGHSVQATYEGDLPASEKACASAGVTVATTVVRADQSREVITDQCLSGIYMQEYDQDIASGALTPQDTLEGWLGEFPYCSKAMSRYECAVSFALLAAERPASSYAFMAWCLELSDGHEGCMRYLAQGLSTNLVLSSDPAFFDTCLGVAAENGFAERDCVDGLRHAARLSARGGSQQVVCDLLGKYGEPCT